MPQKGSSDQTVACFRRLGAGVVGSDYDEFRNSGDESGSHATRRWREQDSNSRSRRERNGRWEARHISFRAQLYELGARQSRERPKSSNPSPPAGSPVRTWLFGAKPINSRRANRVATARHLEASGHGAVIEACRLSPWRDAPQLCRFPFNVLPAQPNQLGNSEPVAPAHADRECVPEPVAAAALFGRCNQGTAFAETARVRRS